jgi:hypothetical protein
MLVSILELENSIHCQSPIGASIMGEQISAKYNCCVTARPVK